jgi:hypothetical protein
LRVEGLEIYRKEIARNYQKFSSEIGLFSKRNDGNYFNLVPIIGLFILRNMGTKELMPIGGGRLAFLHSQIP